MSSKRRSRADEPFLVVRSLAYTMAAGARIEDHRHDWHQLIYAASGLLDVRTARGAWIVPPLWAVWVPAGTAHSIRFAARSELRTLYLRPEWTGDAPDTSALSVSPLLCELVLRATREGMLDRRDSVEQALAVLLLDEFARAGAPPFDLPQPRSPALVRAAALLTEGKAPGSAALASAVGLSPRALERGFLAETGLTPGRWRRRHALLGSLERLAAGTPIKQVAAACGYATPSAFTAAFRAAFGTTPGRYLAARGLPDGAASA